MPGDTRGTPRKTKVYQQNLKDGTRVTVREYIDTSKSPRRSRFPPTDTGTRYRDDDPGPRRRRDSIPRTPDRQYPFVPRTPTSRDDRREHHRSRDPLYQADQPRRNTYSDNIIEEEQHEPRRRRVLEYDEEGNPIDPSHPDWGPPTTRNDRRSYGQQSPTMARNDQYRDRPKEPRTPKSSPPTRPITYTANEFKGVLDVDPVILERHLAAAIEGVARLPQYERAGGTALLNLPQFRNWAKSKASSVVIVQGNDKAYTDAAFSAISDSVAILYHWLAQNGDSIPIAFFCGCHVEDSDGSKDDLVNKMLRSILYLFAKYDRRREYRTEFFNGRYAVQFEVADLCRLMKTVVKDAIDLRTIPNTTFLIDCANFLETRENVEDFKIVLEAFRDLISYAREDRHESIFKVMLFFPYRSKYAYKMVSRDGILDITDQDLQRLGQGKPVNTADELQQLWCSNSGRTRLDRSCDTFYLACLLGICSLCDMFPSTCESLS